MQTLDITLSAGEFKTFDIGGAYFEFIEGTAALDINFVDSQGSRAKDLEMLGALPGYWVGGSFSRFELKNLSTLQQTVRIMYGSGQGGSRRIQGVVQVVDSRSARTRANQAFAWRYSKQAAAAQYATSTLANPGGSGKRIVVTALTVGTSIAGGVTFGIASAPVVGAATTSPQNKLSGGAATVATVNETSGILGGGSSVAALSSIFLQANASQYVVLQEPIVLLPGATLGLQGETVQQQIAGSVEFYEEPNT